MNDTLSSLIILTEFPGIFSVLIQLAREAPENLFELKTGVWYGKLKNPSTFEWEG